MSSRGDAWACFGDEWPGVAEHGFDGTDSWVRLGEIPNDEAAFWKACSLQQNGGARSAWKAKVDFYLHVYADSPALPSLGLGEAKEAAPFWLGLVPFAGSNRLFVSSAKVTPAVLAHRAPERHPGLIPVQYRPLGFRLRLANGTYFDVAR